MKSSPPPVHQISLRLRELGQIFNSMDPTPFHHRDLDPDAEEFIESWAHEFPAGSRFQLIVHLAEPAKEPDPSALLGEAIHNYYAYKAEMSARELRRLMRLGRVSLLVGIGFLALCTLGARAIGTLAAGPYGDIASEGLVIAGWVAMWRPIQIFLYEWWPVVRRRKTYLGLAHTQVRVIQGS